MDITGTKEVKELSILNKQRELRFQRNNISELQKKIEMALYQRDFYKKLYEDEVAANDTNADGSDEKWEEAYSTLEEQYKGLKKVFETELLENEVLLKEYEKRNYEREQNKIKQEGLFYKRREEIMQTQLLGAKKIEVDLRQKCNETQRNLQNSLNIKIFLKGENSELSFQQKIIKNTEQMQTLKNMLAHRKVQLAGLEKERDTAKIKLDSLQNRADTLKLLPTDNDTSGNIACKHDNSTGLHGKVPRNPKNTNQSEVTYSHGNISGNQGNSESVHQEGVFEYSVSTSTRSSLRNNYYNDDWNEEDYARNQHNFVFQPTAIRRPSSTICPSTSRNVCVVVKNNECEITSTTNCDQPSTSGFKVTKDTEMKKVPSRPKKRKLLSESQLNASIFYDNKADSESEQI